MTYAIVTGFARSGKSTLTKELSKLSIAVASSSDVLAVETLKHFGLDVNDLNLEILENKENQAFRDLLWETYEQSYSLRAWTPTYYNIDRFYDRPGSDETTCRGAKIYVAEVIIVPEHTRKFFAKACLESFPEDSNHMKVIFSTIGSEREELVALIETSDDSKYVKVNLRREDELTGVDTRSLWDDPDIEIHNNCLTEKELVGVFLKKLYDFK